MRSPTALKLTSSRASYTRPARSSKIGRLSGISGAASAEAGALTGSTAKPDRYCSQ